MGVTVRQVYDPSFIEYYASFNCTCDLKLLPKPDGDYPLFTEKSREPPDMICTNPSPQKCEAHVNHLFKAEELIEFRPAEIGQPFRGTELVSVTTTGNVPFQPDEFFATSAPVNCSLL